MSRVNLLEGHTQSERNTHKNNSGDVKKVGSRFVVLVRQTERAFDGFVHASKNCRLPSASQAPQISKNQFRPLKTRMYEDDETI